MKCCGVCVGASTFSTAEGALPGPGQCRLELSCFGRLQFACHSTASPRDAVLRVSTSTPISPVSTIASGDLNRSIGKTKCSSNSGRHIPAVGVFPSMMHGYLGVLTLCVLMVRWRKLFVLKTYMHIISSLCKVATTPSCRWTFTGINIFSVCSGDYCINTFCNIMFYICFPQQVSTIVNQKQ